MDEKDFQKLLKEHNELLASVEGRHKSLLTEKQKKIFQEVRDNFIDKLEVDENGRVTMSASNIATLNSIDTLFDKMSSEIQNNLVKTFASNLSGLIQSNANYYSAIEGKAKVLPILPKVNKAMSGWLGITDGTPQKNGFIDQLINDTTAKIAVKNMAMKIVIGQQGLESAKDEMKTLIEGNKDRLGMFEKHYKTFANDLYSQIDRATSNVIRSDLKFEFAIYVGGLVEKSREFCIEHNAKVYHVSEILKFKPEVGIPPNYDPIHDLGGYNCRHYLRWISTAMAKAKGKNVEDFIQGKPKVEPKPKTEPKPKAKEKPKVEEKTVQETPKPFLRIPINQKFDDIETLKIQEFKIPENWKKIETEINDIETATVVKISKLNVQYQEELKKLNSLKTQRRQIKTREEDVRFSKEEYNPQIKKINQVVNDINKATREKQRFIAKKSEEEFKKIVETTIHKELNVSFSYKKQGDKVKEWDETFELFKKVAGKFELRDNYIVNTDLKRYKNRANYDNTKGGNTVNILKGQDKGVILHELIHSVENNNFAFKQAVEFLERRTAGQPIKSLKTVSKSYDAREKYKEGGFFDAYVGKVYQSDKSLVDRFELNEYKNYNATEVLTMGVQKMFENPFDFYRKDPEHFNFIYTLFFK